MRMLTCYRGDGAGAMATLQTAALNLLRLAGFQSIRGGGGRHAGVDERHHSAAGLGDAAAQP
jgi:hypothetical protein